MPHIAFYISALRKGGAERVMVNLIEYFKKRGYRVTLVTQYSAQNEYVPGEDVPRIFSDILPTEETGSRIRNFIRRYRKLRNIWKELNPDIILSFIGMNNIMALLTTKRLGIPVAVAVRGDPKEEYAGKKLRFLCHRQFKNAAALILQTHDSIAFFEKRAQEKAVVLRNPLSAGLLEIRPIEEKEKRIVTAGRLDGNKNQEGIIKAFASCLPKHPEYTLSVYGDGEDREKLEKLVEDLGLKGSVEFTGSVDNVWDRMNTANIFVLNSYTEGMPNALLEAMALGLACISTDCPCGGPKEIIENKRNGLLVPVGNEEELAKSLLYLMDNEDEVEKLGREAISVRESFSPETVMKTWEETLCNAMRG